MLLTLVGALLYCIFVWQSWASAAKVIMIGVLTILANPVGGHAMARAAYRIGIRPERELVVDELADEEACVETGDGSEQAADSAAAEKEVEEL